jgi:hypothetical protein
MKLFWLLPGACLAAALSAQGQAREVRNSSGLQLSADTHDHDPALILVVPSGPENERRSRILFPEHVTVRAHGQSEAKHLYIFRPGPGGESPRWTKSGNALEYAAGFGEIRFIARATLLDDGIVFRYQFANPSATDYDMATAITDPRFHGIFYDPRLERTCVHHRDGFNLLASETPARLAMPLARWFPVRYLASYLTFCQSSIFLPSLEDALRKVSAQREALK